VLVLVLGLFAVTKKQFEDEHEDEYD